MRASYIRLSHAQRLLLTLVAFISILISSIAYGHRQGESYVFIDYANNTVHWDVEARIFDEALQLDINGNHIVSWPEYESALPLLKKQLLSGLKIGLAGEDQSSISFTLGPIKVSDIDQGTYLSTQILGLPTPLPAKLSLHYQDFFELDPAQSLLIKTQTESSLEDIRILTSSEPSITLERHVWLLKSLGLLFKQGFEHMMVGLDHLAFILLLTTSFYFHQVSNKQTGPWRKALPPLALLISVFTLGHGISLLLISSKFIQVSSYWIELAIAATLIVTAVGHLVKKSPPNSWLVFLFGLIHGSGFATGLIQLDFEWATQLLFITSFNLGIEIGQLLSAAFFILAFSLTRQFSTIHCKLSVIIYVFILSVGMYWFFTRL